MTENTPPEGGVRATNVVRIDGIDRTVERVSGRKASAAFGLVRAISGKVPDLAKKWGTFVAEYEATHTQKVDRARALAIWGPQPIIDEQGIPLVYPNTLTIDGETVAHPRAGETVMTPNPFESMTEEAWAAQDGHVERPRSPSTGECIAAVFPDALEVAEDHIYRLLALALMPNAEVKARRKDGTIKDALTEQADDLIDDAMADELLELAVVFGEVLDEQFRGKLRALEGRVGNALRLIGLNPTRWAPQTTAETPQTTESSTSSSSPEEIGRTSPPTSTPPSPSDTPEPSPDGAPTPSSTPPPTSSPPLAGVSSSSEPN